jgi:hypothetical protein
MYIIQCILLVILYIFENARYKNQNYIRCFDDYVLVFLGSWFRPSYSNISNEMQH